MNKLIKTAVVGACSIILGLGIIEPTAALYIQSNTPVQIHQQPYAQSSLVGYIYDDNIAELEDKGRQGWVKIKSGDVIGWIDKSVVVQGQPNGYTVAKIHPDTLTVYADPDKNSTIYTTVYENQEIECVEYKDDWLTLAFDDGSYGFIDAYQAELKTYYGTAESIQEATMVKNNQQQVQIEETYDLIYQEAPDYVSIDENGDFYYNNNLPSEQYENYDNYNYNQYELTQQQVDSYNNDYNYDYTEPQSITYDNTQSVEPVYDTNITDNSENNEQYNDDDFSEQYYDDSVSYTEEETTIDQSTGSNTPNYDVVGYADQYVGNPYQWGGNSLTDGIDCSHFVWQVLSNTGHYNGGYAVSDGWASLGTEVDSLENAVAGDVIVYPGHVAIYDGEGSLVEAKGSAYGITHDRSASYNDIIAIRHFD